MLPGIGRLGAGTCTIFSQRRQDFLMRDLPLHRLRAIDYRAVDDLELRRYHIEQFADVFTHDTQIAAAIGAIMAWVKFTALARGIIRNTGATTEFALPFFG